MSATTSAPTATDPHARAFGLALAGARIRAGLSQSRLADGAGVDHSFVSRAEKGLRGPTRETVAALADALGSDVRERALLYRAAGYWPDLPANALIIAIEEYTALRSCPHAVAVIGPALIALLHHHGGTT